MQTEKNRMNKIERVTTGRGVLEWVTIDGEGKENLSGKLQYVANLVVDEDDAILQKIADFWATNKPTGFKGEPKSTGIYDHKVDTGETDEDGDKVYSFDGKKYIAFKTGTTFPDGFHKEIKIFNAKRNRV